MKPPGTKDAAACVGAVAPPRYGERLPGRLVDGWVDSPAGPVPSIKTHLELRDTLGRWLRRWGVARAGYRIPPGLYSTGDPGKDSPVLVTANYKMTFDALRRELGRLDAWILALDTNGINVWCAAGWGTFGTEEVVGRVAAVRLDTVVAHRKLVLPQLGAPGVQAHRVRMECGFTVTYGPVHARDLRDFLDNGMQATPDMRRVRFPVLERLALVPMEVVGSLRPSAWAALALVLLAGIGPGFFSLTASWQRGIGAVAVLAAGILGGAVVTPILLPWLPGRAFSVKGALVGAVLVLPPAPGFWASRGALDALSLMLALPAVSSFLAMNFTGATPFTSPSGVEAEMRRAIPLQACAAALAVILWVGGAFVR